MASVAQLSMRAAISSVHVFEVRKVRGHVRPLGLDSGARRPRPRPGLLETPLQPPVGHVMSLPVKRSHSCRTSWVVGAGHPPLADSSGCHRVAEMQEGETQGLAPQRHTNAATTSTSGLVIA